MKQLATIKKLQEMEKDIYRQLERFEDAKAVYRKAIDMDPNNYLSYYNLGVILQKQEFFEDAKDQYIKTINLNPNYHDVYNNMGNTISELGITIEQTLSLSFF